MKRIAIVIVSLLVVAGLVGLLIWGFLSRRAEMEQEAGSEHAAAGSRVKQNAQGDAVVTLDAAAQKRVALQVATLGRANLGRELKAYGRVLDPAPLASLAAELASAQAAAQASRQEFDRLKTLQRQDNASLRALQAAEAAFRRDQLQVQSARDRLRLGWGAAILESPNLTRRIRALTAMEQVLVRLDLPAGETIATPPTGARLVSVLAEGRVTSAAFFGPAPGVDPQTQGQGFLFLVDTNAPGLTPGAAVTGYLELPGEPLAGVLVPRSAVVRYEGRAWIFLRASETTFTRREIALDRPTDQGWFLTGGVAPGDQIVAAGAQTLLAAELGSATFMTGQRD